MNTPKSVLSFYRYVEFEKKLSANTLIAYQTDLGQFLQFINQTFATKDPLNVQHSMIRSWLISLIENQESASTLNRKISCLKSFYKFALRKQMIDHNPTQSIVRPKMPKRIPKQINTSKLLDLKEFLRLQAQDLSFANYRDYTMFMTFYACGIRRNELIELQWAHLDIDQRYIKVRGKGQKDRLIPLHSAMVDIFNTYKSICEQTFLTLPTHIFLTDSGQPMYPNFVYRKIKAYLSMVTTQTGIGPHALRHSFATHLLNSGAEINAIKDILGHSSLAATQVYTSTSIQRLISIHKSAHPKS